MQKLPGLPARPPVPAKPNPFVVKLTSRLSQTVRQSRFQELFRPTFPLQHFEVPSATMVANSLVSVLTLNPIATGRKLHNQRMVA